MRNPHRTLALAISAALASACTTPKITPTAGTLPHNWLSKRLSLLEMQAFKERVIRANGDPKQWQAFFEMVQPGDELWRWEEPEGSNMYPPPRPFGCCIIRGNRIIFIFKIGELGWIE